MKRKPRHIKAWAIMKGRKIVSYNHDCAAVHPMLIFKAAWLAGAAKWESGEKVVKVEIVIR